MTDLDDIYEPAPGAACPKCGGTEGYEVKPIVIVFVGHGAWGKGTYDQEQIKIAKWPKTVRCLDCKARVPLALAEGDGREPPPQRLRRRRSSTR